MPTKCTQICSLNFNSDAYVLSHSPEFLKSVNFNERIKPRLKDDTVLENKPQTCSRRTDDFEEKVDLSVVQKKGKSRCIPFTS